MQTKSDKTERHMLWQSVILQTVKSLSPHPCMQAVQSLSSISGARKEIYSRGFIMESRNVSYLRWVGVAVQFTCQCSMLQVSKVFSIVSVCVLYCECRPVSKSRPLESVPETVPNHFLMSDDELYWATWESWLEDIMLLCQSTTWNLVMTIIVYWGWT